MRTGRPQKASGLSAVNDWLRNFLSGGPRSSKDIRDASQTLGFAWRTVERSKVSLGIEHRKEGHVWFWFDPTVPAPKSEPTTRELLDEIKQTIRTTGSGVTSDSEDAASRRMREGYEWTEKDFEQCSYPELLLYRTEVSNDLAHAQRDHGKKKLGLLLGDPSFIVDNSKLIERLVKRMKRIDKWGDIKFSEPSDQPAEDAVETQSETSV